MSYERALYLKSPQMYGEDVKALQRKLNSLGFNCGSPNGYFGPNTKNAVKKFQKSRGLSVDGSCGPATWKKLFGNSGGSSSSSNYSRALYLTDPQIHGDDVKRIQKKLNYLGYNCGSPNGYFGPNTSRALKKYQRAVGLSVDGSCGPSTWRRLIEQNNLKDVTEALLALFIKYEHEYKTYWSKMKEPGNLYRFYNLVRNGGEADLKNQGYSVKQSYIFNNQKVSGDAPGNILYGYVGKSFRYSDELLLRAAGFAQKMGGNYDPKFGHWNGNPPYGDDPRDQKNIKIGMNFYRRVH